MKIALFGKNFNESFDCVIQSLLIKLFDRKVEIHVYQPFYEYLNAQKGFSFDFQGYFSNSDNLPKDVDFLVCIGGDGTFLEAITLIRDSGIPIVGINSGRLGFLANISANDADHAIDYLLSNDYRTEERCMLKLHSQEPVLTDFPYALNECTIQKIGSSLITIHVSINGEYLTSYWADGLIISTPTGSTAYSLSVGGPIVTPQSRNFIITPIAAHNLNVRPLVIPDDAELKLTVEGRINQFLTSLDSRSAECTVNNEIIISKSPFSANIIKLPQIDFYSTLRNKLMWGADKRN